MHMKKMPIIFLYKNNLIFFVDYSEARLLLTTCKF